MLESPGRATTPPAHFRRGFRFGLLAGLANTFIYNIVATFPLTTQGSASYWGISLTGILLIATLTLYGFHTSLGGRPIFGSAALEE